MVERGRVRDPVRTPALRQSQRGGIAGGGDRPDRGVAATARGATGA